MIKPEIDADKKLSKSLWNFQKVNLKHYNRNSSSVDDEMVYRDIDQETLEYPTFKKSDE